MNSGKCTIAPTLAAIMLVLALAGCAGRERMIRPQVQDDLIGSDIVLEQMEHSKWGADPWSRKLADRYFLEGSILQMQERYADAIVQYRRALRFMPQEYSVVHFAIARCYQLLGIPDTAMIYAREAVQRDSENIDARGQLAELMMANGRIQGAVRQYEEILRIQPANLQARFSLAQILQWSDPTRAAEQYEYLRTRFEGSYDILLSLTEIYLNLGRFDEAISAMRELVAISPADADLYRLLSDVYIRAGRYGDALDMLPEIELHLLPTTAFEEFVDETLDSVAERMREDRAPAFAHYAERLAEQASARFPLNWQITFNSGLINYQLGREAAADSLLLKALSSEDATPVAWMETAILYINDGRSQRGLGVLLPTSARYDDDYRIPYLLGYAYLLLDSYDSAESNFRRSIALEEENSEAWGHLAMIYSRKEMTATSDAAYERALQYDQFNTTFLNNYAYSLADRGKRLDKALMMVQLALESEPENESFLDTRGWIYYKMGEYTKALVDIQQAVDIGGASAEVLAHLGDVQLALGDRDAAREAYEQALRLHPNDKTIRDKLDLLR